MKILSNVKIRGIGAHLPDEVITNDDLSKIVDTSDEWITTRTGIKERRKAAESEGCVDLSYKAAKNLESQGYNVSDVDLIIVATMSPDHYTPSVSAQLQGRLGLSDKTMVMDINAACAGFVQAIQIANALITVGQNKKALIIGVEVLSRIVDYTDRSTCVLFGDGAGAVLMEYDIEQSIYSVNYGSDGKSGDKLYCTNLSKTVGETVIPDDKHRKIVQDGRGVYNFVIKTVPDGVKKLLNGTNYKITDLNWFIPHSANLRMIQFISKLLKIPMDKVLESITKYGNTSAATIPLALWNGRCQGKLKSGDLIAAYGFGGGLNHAGALFRWFE